MPDAALASIPEPLLFAITDNTGDPISQRILKERKFTMVVTKNDGELQLGGHDNAAIAPGHEMKFIKTTSTAEYSVPITSIKFGGVELLEFATVINPRVPGRMAWIPGILDSGTSCIVMPDSLLHGVLKSKPFTKLVGLIKNPLYAKTRRLPLTLEIGGYHFSIPFDEWWLEADNRPCIQSSPDAFMGVLLGDVFFRSLVVQFDLTHPTIPVIGLAPRNPEYHPVRPGSDWEKHKPKNGFDFGIPEGFDGSDAAASSAIDKVPLDTGLQTQIFVTISVGTPRQHFKVILDTGSSVLGIFCDSPPKKGEPRFAHIYLPHFIPFGGNKGKEAMQHPRRPSSSSRGRIASPPHGGSKGSKGSE
uniref:Peptidase A1 domain-containing protein n=2 Tax=Hemiselmis andersenii TaxID=464988 RepID=A0A6U2CCJ1_HEMAN|mmetsp:Transcript_19293/g.44408  ORF Transcript_19293/g.44408 Transcript_19293/m.44408 type:complete len:360 (+) Transcript_19293:655-1734(+)